jgi:hypothetical protein
MTREPTPGGGFERMVQRRIFSTDVIPRRIVTRFTIRSGQLERVSIVLEDHAHSRFHRHEPGW